MTGVQFEFYGRMWVCVAADEVYSAWAWYGGVLVEVGRLPCKEPK